MSQVSVTLVRADTNQEFDVELPDDAIVGELLPALVKELGLPLTGPDGNQVAYELSNKRTGREYKEAETLGGAGTKTGDSLLLTSTFVAGAGPIQDWYATEGSRAKSAGKRKGLRATVYTDADYGPARRRTGGGVVHAAGNLSHIIIVGPGIPEVFEAFPDEPVFQVFEGSIDRYVAPVTAPPGFRGPPSCGGAYVAHADSRICQLFGGRAALPLHDRFEA